MSESGGYIKLWRKLEQWLRERGASPAQKWTTVEMLFMANWRDEDGIPRGSFASSQRDIASRAGVDRQVVRNTLELLAEGDEDGPFVIIDATQRSTQHLSIYTIQNYDKYQGDDAEQNPASNPVLVGRKPSAGRLETHSPYSEEVKKEEEGAKSVAKRRTAKPLSPLQQAADEVGRAYSRHLLEYRRIVATVAQNDKARRPALVALRGDPGRVGQVCDWARAFVELEDDYLRENGWSWHLFPSRLNRVQAPAPRQRVPELCP